MRMKQLTQLRLKATWVGWVGVCLPLAWGIGPGADMLRPLAIAVIGALCISVLLSLVATPAAYFVMLQFKAPRI